MKNLNKDNIEQLAVTSLTDEKDRKKQIFKVTIVGSILNVLLVVLKFLAGIFGQSAAMIADAVHSLSDFVTDIIVLVFVNVSAKPQDSDHDYGHGKYETLATIIVGLILMFVGVGLFLNGAEKIIDVLFHDKVIESPGKIALIAAIISIFTKETLYHYTVFTGKKVNSQVIIANAWHHRSDAFSSIGAAIGIAGALFLGDKWRVLDPIAAVVVSLFIVRIAIQLFVPAVNELLEKSLPKDIEDEIMKIARKTEGVGDPHNLRTRRIGNNIAIELHIRVTPSLSVSEAHIIATEVEKRLRVHFGQQTHTTIHVEPEK